MPIYEYRCASCDLKSSFFTRSVYVEVEAVCSHCGSDPSNIGRHAEKSFERFGVDMPESVRGMIDEARKGKMPDGLDL